jgi:hypothetical protein
MAVYKFINQILYPIGTDQDMLAHVKYEHGPYAEIKVYPTRHKLSYRVFIIGRQLGNGTPLTATVWIKMNECDGLPGRAINVATHKVPRLLYRFDGSRVAQLWQKSGLPKALARGVNQRLTSKWGKGWLCGKEWRARAEAERWLEKALVVAGVPRKRMSNGGLVPLRHTKN